MQKIHFLLRFITVFMFSTLQLSAQNLDREIKEIVEPLVASISSQPVKNVAISDFTLLDGTPTELGKYLAEEFSLSLINAKKSFVVIDRSRVTALLKENNLGGSGLIDPNTIAKLGKMKGIDALIAGTLTSTGNTIRLIVKVWNLESQGLVAGNKGDISKTPFIMELEGKVVSGGANNISGGTQSPVVPRSNTNPTFTQDNLEFEALSCTQLGNRVVCRLKVVSKDKDSKGVNFLSVSSFAYSKIYDEDSNEFLCDNLKIANLSGSSIIKDLIANSPVNMEMSFKSIDKKINFISMLTLRYVNGGLEYQAELRKLNVK